MAVLPSYEFHNGKTGKYSTVGAWSYLAAALLGSLYVLLKSGFTRFPIALFWHLAFLGALALLPFVLVYLPPNLHVILLLLGVPGILLVQSLFMIGCVRQSFRARGWGERRPD